MYTSIQLTKRLFVESDSRYHVTQQEMFSEQEVVNLAKSDPSMFEGLYTKYYEQVFNYLYQRLEEKEIAKDTVQQVFYKAMVNLKNYEYKGVPFASWLYRIAQNELNMFYRKNNKQRVLNIDDDNLEDMMEELKENVVEKEKQYDKLAVSIAKLSTDEIQLVEMRFFESRSFKEIGEILEITENNAKVRTYRILEKIKKSMH